jgi:hypothetical protein
MNSFASRLAWLALVCAFAPELPAQESPETTQQDLAQPRERAEAIADAAKAVEPSAEAARSYYTSGAAKHRSGDTDGARLDREKALALDPGGSYPPYPRPEPLWQFFLQAVGLFGSLIILVVQLVMIFARQYITAGPQVAEIWGVSPENLRQLPASFVHRGDLNEGGKIRAIAMGWGLVGIAASLLGTLYHWQTGNRDIGHLCLVLLIALVVATPLAYRRGARLGWAARRLVVTADGVSVTVPEGGYGQSWSEPLAGYTGVLGEKEVRGSGDDTYNVAVFQLIHPRSQRTLRLYQQRARLEDSVEDDPDARRTWEAFAEVLGVPALTKAQGGYVAREPEDLAKPVGELVREGKVDFAFDARSPVPDGIRIDEEGDATVATVCAAPFPRSAKVSGIALGLGMVIFGLWMKSPLGIVLGAGMFLITSYWRFHDARVRIAHDGVYLASVIRGREVTLVTMSPEEIEDVKVTSKYPSDLPAWRALPVFPRVVITTEHVLVFLAELAEAFSATFRQTRAGTTIDRGGAARLSSDTVPGASAAMSDGTKALQFVTDRAAHPIPVRMSPEAADWLRGLILSLLASDADAPASLE